MYIIINEELGADISPEQLQRFIRERWNRISVLAHRIHHGG